MTTEELIIEGAARGVERALEDDQFVQRIADRAAGALADHFELLTTHDAAMILGCTKETLQANHLEWGLDKSLAFGPKQPRYFLSQILDRAREKVLKAKPKKEEKLRVSGCFDLKEKTRAA